MMKNGFVVFILFLLLSCKLTDSGDSGNGTGFHTAELVLTNKIEHTINVILYDGSSPSGLVTSLAPNEGFRKTWQDYEPVFTEQNGVLTIRYSSSHFSAKEINIVLQTGKTKYYDLHLYESSFTFYNNTFYTIDFYLDDGSTSSNMPKTVQSSESYVQTWVDSDPLYTNNQGIVNFSYINPQGDEINQQYYIPPGTHVFEQVDDAEYILKITNCTNADAWYSLDDTSYPPLEPDDFDMYYPQDISGYSTKYIEYSGYHVFTDTDAINISSYFSTDFDIEPDAGAISIKNDSDLRINEVFITENSAQSWGYNVLADFLYHNEEAIWTVSEGNWDIRIIDENEVEYQARDFYVGFDSTKHFFFPADFPEVKMIEKKGLISESKVEFKGILRN